MPEFSPDQAFDAVIGENLRILAQVMVEICQRSTLEEASSGELSANQFAILRILAQHEATTASDFARILSISAPAVSKKLDRLAELDMVARDPHPHDRRSAALVLQPAGHALLERYNAIAGRKISGILSHFDAHEKAQLLDHLKRIIRHTLSDAQDIDLICYQCGGRCGDDCVIEDRRGTCVLKDKQGD